MKNLTRQHDVQTVWRSRVLRNACLLVLVALVTSVATAEAGRLEAADSPNLFRDLKHNAFYTFGQMPTYQLMGLMAMTPAVFSKETNRPYLAWVDHPRVDHTFELGAPLGSAYIQFGGSLSTYFLGKILDKPGLSTLGSDLFSSQMIAATVSTGMKVATHRTRPNGAPYSFPSGHTTLAFSAAGVIAGHYGLVPGLLAEGAATYVGLSRLQENKHYISDVVAGCVLGNFVAFEVMQRRGHVSRLGISAMPVGDTRGVALSLKF